MILIICVLFLKPKLSTHSIKVHLHCDKCEKDLRDKLLKHRSKDFFSSFFPFLINNDVNSDLIQTLYNY